MEITATLVKQLRDMTDAGMMECKKALVEVNGDIEKAIEYLREKGLSKAAKKADRIAAEGTVALKVNSDLSQALMVEVNSETDFVAKNDNFKELCAKTIDIISNSNINSVEELNNAKVDGASFEEYLKSQIAKIGENIVVRRFINIKSNGNVITNGYLHSNGKVGTIISLSFNNENSKAKLEELSKSLCMHAAAMKPQIISYDEFSDEFIKKEKNALIAEIEKENEELKRLGKTLKVVPEYISKKELNDEVLSKKEAQFKESLKEQKKPEAIWDKILPGLIDRFIVDNTLLDQRLTLLGQFFVMDDKKTIAQILDEKSKELNDTITITSYTRYELGEGIEKKEEDFAKEVANQLNL